MAGYTLSSKPAREREQAESPGTVGERTRATWDGEAQSILGRGRNRCWRRPTPVKMGAKPAGASRGCPRSDAMAARRAGLESTGHAGRLRMHGVRPPQSERLLSRRAQCALSAGRKSIEVGRPPTRASDPPSKPSKPALIVVRPGLISQPPGSPRRHTSPPRARSLRSRPMRARRPRSARSLGPGRRPCRQP